MIVNKWCYIIKGKSMTMWFKVANVKKKKNPNAVVSYKFFWKINRLKKTHIVNADLNVGVDNC